MGKKRLVLMDFTHTGGKEGKGRKVGGVIRSVPRSITILSVYCMCLIDPSKQEHQNIPS